MDFCEEVTYAFDKGVVKYKKLDRPSPFCSSVR